tara:strand:- start:689 stop:979 length:291 start_codon:yes stop_codon:yes gene_type:complete
MEFKKNKGTKKQEKTYGPMGLSEVRLRALINEDEEAYKFIREVCGPLVCFYEFLKSKGYTDDECYLTAKRLCMINLGRYMEEDTDYEEYIVETHYD